MKSQKPSNCIPMDGGIQCVCVGGWVVLCLGFTISAENLFYDFFQAFFLSLKEVIIFNNKIENNTR